MSYKKFKLGRKLNNAVIIAEAKETLFCLNLAVLVIIGVGVNYFFDMGLKINWRGEFDGDDEYLTDLFIKRNEDLIEASKKNLRRLSVEDAFVHSRKVLFRKYYKADEIVKTMRDVLQFCLLYTSPSPRDRG